MEGGEKGGREIEEEMRERGGRKYESGKGEMK